jgi:hypothetical protein
MEELLGMGFAAEQAGEMLALIGNLEQAVQLLLGDPAPAPSPAPVVAPAPASCCWSR